MAHDARTPLTQNIDLNKVEPIAKSLPQRELKKVLGITQIYEISPKKKLNIEAIEKFIYKDDHWQNGDAWMGWKPSSTTNPSADEEADWDFVRDNFVYKNILKRIPQRIEGAVLGYRPHIEILDTQTGTTSDTSPEQEDDSNLKALHETLTTWLDNNDIFKHFKTHFISRFVSQTHAAMMLKTPRGFVDNNGNILEQYTKDLESLLKIITLDFFDVNNSGAKRDPNYGREFTYVEIPRMKSSQEDFATNFLNENNDCCVRYTIEGKEELAEYKLNGKLLTHVASNYEEPIIDGGAISQQKAANHSLSMMNFAGAKVNFPPIFILNAEEFEGETTGSSGRKQQTVGINSIFRLVGRILYGGVDGMSEQQVKPSIVYGKTSEPEKHRDTIQAYELHIYDSAGMGWVKINESPYASARSRTEALTDYLILVTEIASVVENAGSWLLETLLNYAYNLLDGADKLDGKLDDLVGRYKVNFSCKLLIKVTDNEDKQLMLSEVEAGVRSGTDYMVATRITKNPENMKRQIELELVAKQKEETPPQEQP